MSKLKAPLLDGRIGPAVSMLVAVILAWVGLLGWSVLKLLRVL
jgi:hypothetical protein